METKLIVVPASEVKAIILEALSEMENIRADKEKERKEQETLFTINQVARRLGRAHNTIKKLVAEGVLKTTSDGLISEKSINDYLRNA
ncbi:hypothetical protein CYCD_10370 [Tenuifilaceae bacterium CYCD]|nr:hypothetical protein CYCD_10370 [Tenuifilaceae bacterium CYCD]